MKTIDEVTERVKSAIRDAFATGKLPDTIAATVDIYHYDDSILFDAALKDHVLRQKLLDFYTRTTPADAMQSPEDRVSEFEYQVYRHVNDWLSSQPFLGLQSEGDAPLAGYSTTP